MGVGMGTEVGKDIELRSEEFQEVLGEPPHAIIRWGIAVLAATAFVLIVGSFFFKFPDTVTGEITITTQRPPVWLVAKSGGRLTELNCVDKQTVAEGDILAVIENTAKTKDVITVKRLLKHCIINDSTFSIPDSLIVEKFELGTVQSSLSAFAGTAVEYRNFLSLGAIQEERKALQLQIAGHRRRSQILQKQLELQRKELAIAEGLYARQLEAYEKKSLSKLEFERAERDYIAVQQSFKNMEASLVNDRIEEGQLQESLSKLDVQYLRERNSLLSSLKAARSELETAIDGWEQTCLLLSPIAGQATLGVYWAENQFVGAGDRVIAVVPDNAGALRGRMLCPEAMSEKVKRGQRVVIRLTGYPHTEYGTIEGRVMEVALLAAEKNYAIEIGLPDGLKTSAGRALELRGELTGEADIITEERSLMERMAGNIF